MDVSLDTALLIANRNEILPLILAFTVPSMMIGFRFGPVRALSIGWKSYFKKTSPQSFRGEEVQKLRDKIQNMRIGSYIAVIGSKGDGKSCLIDTALRRQYGVVKIDVEQSASSDRIVDKALRGITGVRIPALYQTGNARRVLFFYSLFFKLPPIVVIRNPEQLAHHKYSDLNAASRVLVDDFGLRVVVDNYPDEIRPYNRESAMYIQPMSRQQIEGIPELAAFISLLRKCQLDNLIWKVFGGSPAMYTRLKSVIDKASTSHTNTDVIREKVKSFLDSALCDAFDIIYSSTPNTKKIIKFFRDRNIVEIDMSDLWKEELQLDHPNNVFKIVRTPVHWTVQPSTAAVSLIISEKVKHYADARDLLDKLFDEPYEKL